MLNWRYIKKPQGCRKLISIGRYNNHSDFVFYELLYRVVQKSLCTHTRARSLSLSMAHVNRVSSDCDLDHYLLSAVPRKVSCPDKVTGSSGHSASIKDGGPHIASKHTGSFAVPFTQTHILFPGFNFSYSVSLSLSCTWLPKAVTFKHSEDQLSLFVSINVPT